MHIANIFSILQILSGKLQNKKPQENLTIFMAKLRSYDFAIFHFPFGFSHTHTHTHAVAFPQRYMRGFLLYVALLEEVSKI